MKHNLLSLRSEKGWTQDQAAEAMGISRSHYVKLERGERGLTGHTINLAARAFGTSVAMILGEDENTPARKEKLNEFRANDVARRSQLMRISERMSRIIVIGRAEAGTFREVEDLSDLDYEPDFIYDEPDRDFPQARQFAVTIQGDSMNAAEPPIIEGSRLICVDFGQAGVPLSDGMTVLVQRTRDGGLTREWSVKEVEMGDDTISFCPRSTNSRHKPIIIPIDAEPDDGVQVEVLGIGRRITAPIPRFRTRKA